MNVLYCIIYYKLFVCFSLLLCLRNILSFVKYFLTWEKDYDIYEGRYNPQNAKTAASADYLIITTLCP